MLIYRQRKGESNVQVKQNHKQKAWFQCTVKNLILKQIHTEGIESGVHVKAYGSGK